MLSENLRHEIATLMGRYPSGRGALVTALHLARAEKCYLSVEDFADLAQLFDLPPAEIESTALFYDMLQSGHCAKFKICVCTNVSCMLRGSEKIVDRFREKLGIGFGESTPDGMFMLEEAECLGACDIAPMITLNDEFMGPITVEKVDSLIDTLRRQNAQGGAGGRG
jgi:NADH-quinone oxidoreductase subunit E